MVNTALPLWTDTCKPIPEVIGDGIPEQSWAADFGEMLDGRASQIYTDPTQFFEMTYITENMRTIFVNVLRAATGNAGQRILEIDTPFGGGKTHCVIALYHLIKNFKVLQKHPKVQDIYKEASFDASKQVKIATIVGTELNPLGTLHEESGITTQTLMGEIVYQLAPDLYPRIRANDEKRVSPGTGLLGKLFEQIGPCVILIDELLEYIAKAMSESGMNVGQVKAHMLSFLQEIFTVVANSQSAVLVTTYPSGGQQRDQIFHKEAEDVQMEMKRFISSKREVQNRHHMTMLVATTDTDVANILKARLFKKVPGPDNNAVKIVADSFWTYYSLNQDRFPGRAAAPEYLDALKQCYPFHPELIRILHGQWSTLPKFQKTRALVKLIAEVVRYSYKVADKSQENPLSNRALLLPGAIDLADGNIRAILLNSLEEDYKPVLEEDLARARNLDIHKLGRMQKERYAYAMTVATFLHSFTGATSQESPRQQVASRGAYPQDILLAVVAPHINVSGEQSDGDLPPIGQIQDIIMQLTTGTESLYYLHCNASRQYFFSIRTNLVAFADAQRRIIRDVDVVNAIKVGIQEIWPTSHVNPNVKLLIFPEDPKDIPDNADPPHIKLVLMSPELYSYTPGMEDLDNIDQFAQNANIGRGTTGAIPRNYKKTVFFLTAESSMWADCIQAQRNERAWKITVESPQFKEANKYEQEQAQGNWKKSQDTIYSYLRILFARLFRSIDSERFGLDPEFNLPHLLQQTQTPPFSTVLDWLKKNQIIFTQLKPAILANHFRAAWGEKENEVSLAMVWERFAKNTTLPVLESADILRACAEEGTQTGHFSIGIRKTDQGAYTKVLDPKHLPSLSNFSEYWLIRDTTVIKLTCKSCKAEVYSSDLQDDLCPNCQKVRCWRCGATVKRSELDETRGCVKCRNKEQCSQCGKFSKPEDILPVIGKCVHCQEKLECPACKQYRYESELHPAKLPTHCEICESWSACARCGKRIPPEEYDQADDVIHYCIICLQQTARKCVNCGAKQELYNLRPIPENNEWENATFTRCLKCESRIRCSRCNKWTTIENVQKGLCPECVREEEMEERIVEIKINFKFEDIFDFQSQINDLCEKLSQFPPMLSKGECTITFEESRVAILWKSEEEAKKAMLEGIIKSLKSSIEMTNVTIKKVPKKELET